MMRPLISVIVPVYKVEDVLARCLDSLCRQSLQNIEILLVDDASPDRCGAISPVPGYSSFGKPGTFCCPQYRNCASLCGLPDVCRQ